LSELERQEEVSLAVKVVLLFSFSVNMCCLWTVWCNASKKCWLHVLFIYCLVWFMLWRLVIFLG
jgi:hypothetical protein